VPLFAPVSYDGARMSLAILPPSNRDVEQRHFRRLPDRLGDFLDQFEFCCDGIPFYLSCVVVEGVWSKSGPSVES